MSKLLQVIYISRSTFESSGSSSGIEPNIARILAKSRMNNRKNGLVGVLYFGDGVFFQCLEGEEESVNRLLATLATDNRHKDLKVISKKYIAQLSFKEWAMKFAPLDAQITVFLKENGFQSFDPYAFSDELTSKFLDKLFNAFDPTLELKPTSSNENASAPASETLQINNSAQMKSNLALIFSIIALLISLVTFLTSRM